MYVLSLVIASLAGIIHSCFMFLLLIFGNPFEKKEFPFEALLFHGLSYEEWRTAGAVKKKMDKVQIILDKEITPEGEVGLSEKEYLALLLMLSFSGLVLFRPETPEERFESTLGSFPKEGDVLTSYTLNPSEDANMVSEKKERRVDPKEAEMFASLQQKTIETITNKYYQGTTLSRLVYDGVRIVFKRKKIGPKRPKNVSVFMEAFEIPTH